MNEQVDVYVMQMFSTLYLHICIGVHMNEVLVALSTFLCKKCVHVYYMQCTHILCHVTCKVGI